MVDKGSSLEHRGDSDKTKLTVGVLALDCALFVVFYLKFFPKAFLAQASALTGLVGAVLTLLGVKWGQGSLALGLLEKRTLIFSLILLGLTTALLLLGIARPFEIRTTPGSSIYLDGKLLTTAPRFGAAEDGLVTVLVYASWESHDFASEKQYFLDTRGESRSTTMLSWWQLRPRPGGKFRLRSCLGPADNTGAVTAEWPAEGRVNEDLTTPDGVGDQSLRLFLIAVDHLSTSGYERLPLAVQCARSVELKAGVFRKPFTRGEYLGIQLRPGVQARIDLNMSEPLPGRIVTPAKAIAKQLFRLLAIDGNDDVLRRVESEIDTQQNQLLQAIADHAAAENLHSVLTDLRRQMNPCEADSQMPYNEAVAALSKAIADVETFTRLTVGADVSQADSDLIIDELEELGRLAVFLSAHTQEQQLITALTAIEAKSNKPETRERAQRAITGIQQGPKLCSPREGRSPTTSEVISLPAYKPTPYRRTQD